MCGLKHWHLSYQNPDIIELLQRHWWSCKHNMNRKALNGNHWMASNLVLSAAWSLKGPLSLDYNIPATSCNCSRRRTACTVPSFVQSSSKAVWPWCTHHVLCRPQVTHIQILEPRSNLAPQAVYGSLLVGVFMPHEMPIMAVNFLSHPNRHYENVRPAMWTPCCFPNKMESIWFKRWLPLHPFSNLKKPLSVSPSRANVEPYRRTVTEGLME